MYFFIVKEGKEGINSFEIGRGLRRRGGVNKEFTLKADASRKKISQYIEWFRTIITWKTVLKILPLKGVDTL